MTHSPHQTKYPHLACIGGRPVSTFRKPERVPGILMAARVALVVAQAAIVGAMLLGILYGTYIIGEIK